MDWTQLWTHKEDAETVSYNVLQCSKRYQVYVAILIHKMSCWWPGLWMVKLACGSWADCIISASVHVHVNRNLPCCQKYPSDGATTDLQISNIIMETTAKFWTEPRHKRDGCELLVSWASTLDYLRESKQLTQITVQVVSSQAPLGTVCLPC